MSEPGQGAGDALVEAAIAALADISGLNGAYDGIPLQGAYPYAVVEAGPEGDWSHKSGDGRELTLSITIRDGGEKPARLRGLVNEAERAIAAIGAVAGGWRLVTLVFRRSRMLRSTPAAWSAQIEYRARLLALP